MTIDPIPVPSIAPEWTQLLTAGDEAASGALEAKILGPKRKLANPYVSALNQVPWVKPYDKNRV